jgi:hypothetical protein
VLEEPTLLSNPIRTTLGVAAAWLMYGRIDDRWPLAEQRRRAAAVSNRLLQWAATDN